MLRARRLRPTVTDADVAARHDRSGVVSRAARSRSIRSCRAVRLCGMSVEPLGLTAETAAYAVHEKWSGENMASAARVHAGRARRVREPITR